MVAFGRVLHTYIRFMWKGYEQIYISYTWDLTIRFEAFDPWKWKGQPITREVTWGSICVQICIYIYLIHIYVYMCRYILHNYIHIIRHIFIFLRFILLNRPWELCSWVVCATTDKKSAEISEVWLDDSISYWRQTNESNPTKPTPPQKNLTTLLGPQNHENQGFKP